MDHEEGAARGTQTRTKRRYAPRMTREARREQVLDSALRVLVSSGYDQLTIASVAREAGVNRTAVYNIFPRLDDLTYALLERQARIVFTQIAANVAIVDRKRDPLELWGDALASFVAAVAESPDTWRLVLLPPASTPRALRRRMREARTQIVATLQDVMAWGLSTLGLPPEADAEMAALVSLELFEGAGRLVLARPDYFNAERIGKFTQAIVARVTVH
jgi:AcrR family transcriptional regulator